MSIAAARSPLWTVRRGSWVLAALQLPFVALPPFQTISRQPAMSVLMQVLLPLTALAIGALHLRHSIALARGYRPVHWQWTFGALCVLVYLPAWWYGVNWSLIAWFVVGSAALLLRGLWRAIAVVAPILGPTATVGYDFATGGSSALLTAVWIGYYLTLITMGSVALYGSARLIDVLTELYAARTALAELAVGRERLRVSRDLHDLLGQSLSAVSLKGDLAMRLLPTNPAAAQREIEGLTGMARTALRDMRAVARDEHTVSLRAEVDAAAAVLGAAGIEARVELELPTLPDAIEVVLGWAVREGATNILRHSEASTCAITALRRNGIVRLEIVNDGVLGPVGSGSGLAGLAARAAILSGTASGRRSPDGRYQLVIEIPEVDR